MTYYFVLNMFHIGKKCWCIFVFKFNHIDNVNFMFLNTFVNYFYVVGGGEYLYQF